jgi:hypothetical protein
MTLMMPTKFLFDSIDAGIRDKEPCTNPALMFIEKDSSRSLLLGGGSINSSMSAEKPVFGTPAASPKTQFAIS